MDNAVDTITAAARDPDRAFAWVTSVELDDTSFDDLSAVPAEFRSLDSKIRMALSKHTTGSEADKAKELVSTLVKKRDELRKARIPRQITGIQLMFLVKQFYRIDANKQVQFELSALMDLAYPGDAQLGPFKDKWDYMIRHCVTQLSDRDKQGILVQKLRKSDLLKPHLEYYDRCPKDHPDNSYSWLFNMIDKIIDDDRMRRNNESLVLAASGKEQKPTKPAAPTGRIGDGGGGASGGGGAGGKAGGKGGKESKGGRNGKKQSGTSSGESSESDSESSSGKGPYAKSLDDFKGTLIKDVPQDQLCCLHFAWGLCKRGDKCNYPHIEACTPAMRKTKNFKRLADYYGSPEDYKKRAAAKAKAKAAPAAKPDGN